jgi:hypothetical protein
MSYILTALWLLFGASAALALSLGIILMYHWFKHAQNLFMTLVATAAYWSVCAALFVTMYAAIVSLS